MNKYFFKIIIIFFILPGFLISFPLQAQNLQIPEDLEQAQQMGEQAIEIGQNEVPNIVERTWNQEVLPVWQKMYDWFKNNTFSRISNFFDAEIKPRVLQEFEKRKDIFGQEFEIEKEKIKQELPELKRTVWERLVELWR